MCLGRPDINLTPPWLIKMNENSNRAWVVTTCSYYWGLFSEFVWNMFPVRNSDLQSSCLAATFRVFKARWLWSLLCSNLRFCASFNLLSSQRLIKSFLKPVPLPTLMADLYLKAADRKWRFTFTCALMIGVGQVHVCTRIALSSSSNWKES